jgi:hypothetical protein
VNLFLRHHNLYSWMLCKVWSYTSQYSLILSCLSWLIYVPFVFVVKIIVEVNYR